MEVAAVMKTILVTGFKVFGDYKVNSSEQYIRTTSVIGQHFAHTLVFNTNVFSNHLCSGVENYGRAIVELARLKEVSAIISLGMSSEAKGLRIEKIAYNWCDGKYCTQSETNRPLNQNNLAHEQRSINFEQWDFQSMFDKFKSLNIKFENQISTFPGNYCCNALMYRTLEAMEFNLLQIPYLFLHIPCSAEAVEGLENFDLRKDLITMEELRKIMIVISESYIIEPLKLAR